MIEYIVEKTMTEGTVFSVPQEGEGFEKYLEIGCGNGHFLVDMLTAFPEIKWIALDMKKKRILKTIEKLNKMDKPQVTLVHGNFFTLYEKNLPRDYFSRIFVNFPDPWFKTKHKKRRVVGEVTLDWYHELLKPGGQLLIATDDQEYSGVIVEAFSGITKFKNLNQNFRTSRVELPATLYQKKWQRLNRTCYFFDFEKV